LFTERCITRDDGLSDPETRHVVGDDFLGGRQRARKLSAQSNQSRAEVFGSRSYVGVMISEHGQSSLYAGVTFKASADDVSLASAQPEAGEDWRRLRSVVA
jgi:hypothetical protein